MNIPWNLSICALLLLMPRAARAEQPGFRVPLTVYAAAAVADNLTTYRVLGTGYGQENNPLVGWMDNRPATMLAVGAAADTAAVWALQRWLGPAHPRLVRVGLYVASGVRVALAVKNDRVARRIADRYSP
jgi:hypothetical protein